MITVYHGSYDAIKSPALSHSRIDIDFGAGFYVTPSYEMAEKWACRKNNPIITEYSLDIDRLSVYEFQIDSEWLHFIIDNRNMNTTAFNAEGYDLLIGATADDKMFATIEQYENDYISEATAIKILNCMKVGPQICIRTDKGLENLRYERYFQLSSDRIEIVKALNRKERKIANELTRGIIRNETAKEISDNEIEEPDEDTLGL